jgi:hypothetical protein
MGLAMPPRTSKSSSVKPNGDDVERGTTGEAEKHSTPGSAS